MIRAIEQATFADVLAYLESAIRHGQRASLDADFLPAAAYAQRFLEEARARLDAPPGSEAHTLGDRGMRAVMAILSHRPALPGRPPVAGLDDIAVARVRMVHMMYRSRLHPLGLDDRQTLRVAIARIVPTPLSAAEQQALGRILRKPGMRLSDVLDFLTSVHCAVPVRRVRAAVQASTTPALVYG